MCIFGYSLGIYEINFVGVLLQELTVTIHACEESAYTVDLHEDGKNILDYYASSAASNADPPGGAVCFAAAAAPDTEHPTTESSTVEEFAVGKSQCTENPASVLTKMYIYFFIPGNFVPYTQR